MINTETVKNEEANYALGSKVVFGLLKRFKLVQLLGHFPERPVWASFMFINGFITIGLLAAFAMTFQVPFIFPSLGASAFLFFFSPNLPIASPRNAIVGHAIGIISGVVALHLCGLSSTPPAAIVGISSERVLAVALSLALAGALMILFKAGHPPAGATALIVSLGIVSKPFALICMELAVIILAMQAILINRLAGINYPFWRHPANEKENYLWSPEKAASASWSAAISWAIFMFINGFITIGILTGVAMLLHVPFIFPSLGATAFLFFFGALLPSASPRNAICGNGVSIIAGYLSLLLFKLASTPPVLIVGVSSNRVLASAFSLALAGALMILFRVPHPPAAATALIVSLGFVTNPLQLLIVEFAVVLLAVQAIGINRLAYIDYPLWQKK